MRSRITTIATTTAIPIPIARQLVSRSSTVGFGWMNPPMQGLYYPLRLHHRDTEAQRDSPRRREILCLVLFKNCHSERSEAPAERSRRTPYLQTSPRTSTLFHPTASKLLTQIQQLGFSRQNLFCRPFATSPVKELSYSAATCSRRRTAARCRHSRARWPQGSPRGYGRRARGYGAGF